MDISNRKNAFPADAVKPDWHSIVFTSDSAYFDGEVTDVIALDRPLRIEEIQRLASRRSKG